MSQLTDFFDETGTDAEGRKFWEILSQNDSYWEFSHDYVQWVFPLPEPSNFNPDAPLLTEEDIQLFHANPKLRTNLNNALVRFKDFIGLSKEPYNKLAFEFPNHNWMRITRVLRSCTLLGLKEEAEAFFAILKKIHEEDGLVSDHSFNYWKEAVYGPDTHSSVQ